MAGVGRVGDVLRQRREGHWRGPHAKTHGRPPLTRSIWEDSSGGGIKDVVPTLRVLTRIRAVGKTMSRDITNLRSDDSRLLGGYSRLACSSSMICAVRV